MMTRRKEKLKNDLIVGFGGSQVDQGRIEETVNRYGENDFSGKTYQEVYDTAQSKLIKDQLDNSHLPPLQQ